MRNNKFFWLTMKGKWKHRVRSMNSGYSFPQSISFLWQIETSNARACTMGRWNITGDPENNNKNNSIRQTVRILHVEFYQVWTHSVPGETVGLELGLDWTLVMTPGAWHRQTQMSGDMNTCGNKSSALNPILSIREMITDLGEITVTVRFPNSMETTCSFSFPGYWTCRGPSAKSGCPHRRAV